MYIIKGDVDMKKSIFRLVCIIVLVVVLSVTALAAYSTKNGISLSVFANADSQMAHCWAECDDSSSISAALSVYDEDNSRIGYNIEYGTTYAYSSLDMAGSYAKAGSSATINGVVTSGPSNLIAYY